jgi:diadenosine tetraphosphate (Ap4A) HIT family hydrolase
VNVEFLLHPRLAQDCLELGRLDLCRALLMNDRRYPWVVLVPERAGVTEIYQLEAVDQQRLLEESSMLARGLANAFRPDKLNIAAIGNLVPQLHLHHVVRYATDAVWPAPVWGLGAAKPYAEDQLEAMADRVRACMPGLRQV